MSDTPQSPPPIGSESPPWVRIVRAVEDEFLRLNERIDFLDLALKDATSNGMAPCLPDNDKPGDPWVEFISSDENYYSHKAPELAEWLREQALTPTEES